VFNNGTAERTRFNFGTGIISFGSLSGSGALANVGASGSIATVQVGALGTSTTFSGTLKNGITLGGIAALTKVGTGKLTLSGADTYTGNTTISAGTLALGVGGSLASPNISVATGATFDVSALSSYALNGSGTLTMGIDKTSGTRTQGQMVLGSKNITYGGALTVNKTGSDTLASGDSFTLVTTNAGATFSGWFSSVSVPTLTSGISWDTNKLATSGVLDIYNFTTTALSLSTPVNTAATVAMLKLANHVSSARAASAYPTGWKGTCTTPGHGTASVDGSGNLTYTPTSGYSGSDSFTVTFYDGHGWQNMAVSVTVGNGNGQSPNLLVSGLQGGDFVLQFAGIPTDAYTVETNSVLDGSQPWVKLGNYTTPSNGIIFVTNNITGGGSLYYRTVYPSY
jgi:autotransporter-associated beta strand protein